MWRTPSRKKDLVFEPGGNKLTPWGLIAFVIPSHFWYSDPVRNRVPVLRKNELFVSLFTT
jgi:hypothetical protein